MSREKKASIIASIIMAYVIMMFFEPFIFNSAILFGICFVATVVGLLIALWWLIKNAVYELIYNTTRD